LAFGKAKWECGERYLREPLAGRELIQLVPWLILTIVVGGAVRLVFALVSGTSLPNAGSTESNDFVRRVSSPSPNVAPPRFPKVEADRQREHILTLEEKLGIRFNQRPAILT